MKRPWGSEARHVICNRERYASEKQFLVVLPGLGRDGMLDLDHQLTTCLFCYKQIIAGLLSHDGLLLLSLSNLIRQK